MAVEKLTFEMNAVGNAVPEMKKVQAQLGNVSKSMQTATASMRTHAAAGRMVARSQGNLTRNLGMASLQFQDIAVQASMGTSALRIMTMQGPQLASVFGPKGMIVGALIAVGGALFMMRDNTEKTSFEFKKFGAAIRSSMEPLAPLFETVKKVFTAFKEAGLSVVNGLIRGFQFLSATVAAVLQRVNDRVESAKLRLMGLGKATQAFFQDLADVATLSAEPIDDLGTVYVSYVRHLGAADTMAGKLRIQSKELAHEAALVNDRIEEQGHVFDLVRKSMADVTKIDIRDFFTKSTEAAEEALKKLQERTQGFADSMKSSFEAGFMSMVDGTKSVKDAFRQMAIDIIAQLYRVLVVQRIVGSFDAAAGTGTGIVGGIMKLAGGFFRANGGPVSGNKPYIVGERGPEMFIPNRSGTVIPNKNMGGGGVVVQQTINVTTGVQQTVRNEIQTLLPQIAEASKAAVLDARRRGGSFANAF